MEYMKLLLIILISMSISFAEEKLQCQDLSSDFDGIYEKVLICSNNKKVCTIIYKNGKKEEKCMKKGE